MEIGGWKPNSKFGRNTMHCMLVFDERTRIFVFQARQNSRLDLFMCIFGTFRTFHLLRNVGFRDFPQAWVNHGGKSWKSDYGKTQITLLSLNMDIDA